MRNIKWLMLGALVLSLGVTQSVSAETPSGCNSNGVGIGITPFVSGSPTVGPVQQGDVITYRVTLSVPPSSGPVLYCNFSGGQLSVTLPDGSNVQTAGFGGATPDVPTVSEGSPYGVDCPTNYVVTAADVAAGSITAYADYGSTARYPTQINGTFDDPSQQETASATTSNSLPVECPEPCVEITKSVDCDVSKVGDEVTYTICIENCGDANLINVVVTDDLLDPLAGFPSVLEPGDPCCIDFPYTIQLSDEPGPVVNQAHVTAIDECDGETQVSDDSEEVTVELVHPELTLEKSCLQEPVEPGGVASFRITVTNTGDVCLVVDVCDLTDPNQCFAENMVMQPDDSGSCDVFLDVPEDTTASEIINMVTASWSICDGGDCLPNTGTVNDETPCSISGGATRTPGFWKTHTLFTDHVLTVHCGGLIDLGFAQLMSIEEVCAYFWANKSKDEDGNKRSELCRARLHASFHAIAANLNNCVPSGGGIPIPPAEIAAILGGEDIGAIKALAGELAAYNESGDDVALVDPCAEPGSATPQVCKGYDQSVVDCNEVMVISVQGKGKGKNK